MSSENLALILNDLRYGLRKILGKELEAVYLYGSQARGDARPDSDIDVLVVLNNQFDTFEMIEKTGQLVADLSLKNDTVISLAFINVEDFAKRQTPFLMNVRRESIRL